MGKNKQNTATVRIREMIMGDVNANIRINIKKSSQKVKDINIIDKKPIKKIASDNFDTYRYMY